MYADRVEGEYLAFEWQHEMGERKPGYDLQGIPPGQEIHAYVHLGEWLEGQEKERIRVTTCFRDVSGKEALRGDAIRVPPTFTDLYSHLQAGDTLDGGWVLMLSNRFSDDPYREIFLEVTRQYPE